MYKMMYQSQLNKKNVNSRLLILFQRVFFVQLFALFFACMAVASNQPRLTENQAIRIIDDAFKVQPLFWRGLAIPYSIERSTQHNDLAMLEVLFNHRLLRREKETKVVKIEDSNRKYISLNYRYSFVDQEASTRISPQGGFYYGYGRLKKILQLSEPYFIGESYYVEAYVQWYVTDIQDWVDAPAFDKARTLRRSLESKIKPLEKRIFLQHDGQAWAFWRGKPSGL
jgi:hypothetical protein